MTRAIAPPAAGAIPSDRDLPAADLALAARIAQHDHLAFEALMRAHNSRLFRVARAILRDDTEAEDAVQDAYLEAYRHIARFRGDSRLATWLTRIVINQSLMRLRKRRRDAMVVSITHQGPEDDAPAVRQLADTGAESPAGATLRHEIRQLLERRLDELPLSFRTVFVMREMDGMTVEDIAESLGIPPATVRTRLFRARALLRKALVPDIQDAALDVFGCAGARCDRIVTSVLARMARTGAASPGSQL